MYQNRPCKTQALQYTVNESDFLGQVIPQTMDRSLSLSMTWEQLPVPAAHLLVYGGQQIKYICWGRAVQDFKSNK